MHYEVGGKWVFATKEEAIACANWIAKEKNIFVCVSETKRKVTHEFDKEAV